MPDNQTGPRQASVKAEFDKDAPPLPKDAGIAGSPPATEEAEPMGRPTSDRQKKETVAQPRKP